MIGRVVSNLLSYQPVSAILGLYHALIQTNQARLLQDVSLILLLNAERRRQGNLIELANSQANKTSEDSA